MERATPNVLNTMVGGGGQAAATAGRGTGNVPYAPGMLTGQFGPQPGTLPPAGPPTEVAQGPSPAPPSGGPPQPAGPMSPQGPMAGASPFLQPEFLFDVYAAIMQALLSASESPGQVGGYY